MLRVAVVDKSVCRPKDCGHPCRKYCPIVRTGGEAIYFPDDKAPPVIDEYLCTGCGICVKRCPFEALSVVNLPEALEGEAFHRYFTNGFVLFRFPVIEQGTVIGILGENGIGKSTILKILFGQIVPNLGRVDASPSRDEVLRYLRGSTTMDVLKGIWEDKIKVSYKPQHVDIIPKVVSGRVKDLISKVVEMNKFDTVSELLNLSPIMDKDVTSLSGGELQRLAIAATSLKEADLYLFDEPSSFLDVEQRLRVARLLHELKGDGKTVIVVEHDLALMDYLSDTVFVVYGVPATYGVVSRAMSGRVGINSYLEGYIKAENVRFRKHSVTFQSKPPSDAGEMASSVLSWAPQDVQLGSFRLHIEPGSIFAGEVLGVVGPNAIGKTTFVQTIIKNYFEAASREMVSYKPQYIFDIFDGTVGSVLRSNSDQEELPVWIEEELLRQLRLSRLLDREVKSLSGGELQALAIAHTLMKQASFYFFDEPCAYLDVEQRLATIRAIKRVIKSTSSAAFVVEHDIMAVDFLSDRLIVFEGIPGVQGRARSPCPMEEGMNDFLRALNITFRRDVETKRPRVNKPGSRLDIEQRARGKFYYQ
jgi:ATP-binding cassette subfamily E protein 1